MPFLSLALPCAVTCIIETLVLLFFKDGKRRMLPQLLCNILTNPTLHILLAAGQWLCLSLQIDGALFGTLLLLVLEIGVVFFEAGLCRLFIKEPFKKRLKVSLILNAVSFLTGLLLSKPLDTLLIFLIK